MIYRRVERFSEDIVAFAAPPSINSGHSFDTAPLRFAYSGRVLSCILNLMKGEVEGFKACSELHLEYILNEVEAVS